MGGVPVGGIRGGVYLCFGGGWLVSWLSSLPVAPLRGNEPENICPDICSDICLIMCLAAAAFLELVGDRCWALGEASGQGVGPRRFRCVVGEVIGEADQARRGGRVVQHLAGRPEGCSGLGDGG